MSFNGLVPGDDSPSRAPAEGQFMPPNANQKKIRNMRHAAHPWPSWCVSNNAVEARFAIGPGGLVRFAIHASCAEADAAGTIEPNGLAPTLLDNNCGKHVCPVYQISARQRHMCALTKPAPTAQGPT